MLLRLRSLIARRKWILWVALALAVILAWWIVVSLLPHHVINTLQQYEEKSNGHYPGERVPAVVSFGLGWLGCCS
ncbi:MAG: hypothetical protein ACLQQB_13955 [Solirubrobacteraceae bacterium]|jgi:hypothetical protein